MAAGRPNIPSELKRKILVEAGHRCAIPTCRAPQVEIAHIVPWSRIKSHEYENLIALCPNCHTRFDKGEIDTLSVRQYKAQLRFLLERYSLFEMDVLDMLVRRSENEGIPFLGYLALLIKRLLDEELVEFKTIGFGMKIGDIKATPDLLLLTAKGRRFMEDFRAGKEIGYEHVAVS